MCHSPRYVPVANFLMAMNADEMKNEGREVVTPPDGGFGYVIALSMIIVTTNLVMINESFGIIFGPFLSTFGNEAQQAAMVSSLFGVVHYSSGIPASVLLQKMTSRKVAFIGSFMCVSGAFLSILVTSVPQLIFTFSFLQGSGYGILLPAIAVTMGDYFQARRSFAINAAMAICSIINAISPLFIHFCMDQYGFRGTLLLLSAITLHLVFAAACLHPVKWYVKTVTEDQIVPEPKTDPTEEGDSLLEGITTTTSEDKECSIRSSELRRRSTVRTVCNAISKQMDLELFQIPTFLSIVIGMALLIASDSSFTALLPWILKEFDFNPNETITLVTVYYMSDLLGKFLLCGLMKFVAIPSRWLQFVGAYIMFSFRTAFMFTKSFWLVSVACAALGLVRCVVQNTVFLVIAEVFPERLITAYTLSYFVYGLVSLPMGWFVGFMATIVQTNIIVIAALAIPPTISALLWTVELLIVTKRKKNWTSGSHEKRNV